MANHVSVEAVVGQSLQTSYAVWVISVTVLPVGIWAVLGTGIAVGLVFQKSIANSLSRSFLSRWFAGEDRQVTEERQSPRRPLAQFFHRNYCLHMTGIFAALGADHLGSLALLGAGACVDAAREERVVRQTLAPRQAHQDDQTARSASWSSGTWTVKQILLAWGFCAGALACLVYGTLLVPLDNTIVKSLLSVFAHFQIGILADGTTLPRSGASNLSSAGLERLGLVMSSGIAFILAVTLFVTWGATSYFVRAPYKRLIIPSSLGATILSVGSVALVYFFAVVLASPRFVHSSEQFVRSDSPSWLFGMFLFIAFLSIGYYGLLTTMRFSK